MSVCRRNGGGVKSAIRSVGFAILMEGEIIPPFLYPLVIYKSIKLPRHPNAFTSLLLKKPSGSAGFFLSDCSTPV